MCKTCTHIKQIYITYQAGWLFWPEIWIFWPKSAKKTRKSAKIAENLKNSEIPLKFGKKRKTDLLSGGLAATKYACGLWRLPRRPPRPHRAPWGQRECWGLSTLQRRLVPAARGECASPRYRKFSVYASLNGGDVNRVWKSGPPLTATDFFFFCSKNSEKYYITCPYCCIFSFLLYLFYYC